MKSRLIKIRMVDFKGVRGEREVQFGKNTLISGCNGSGKTTVQDAHLWLWADKDSSLKSNPNIRPDDGRECIPTVEEEWEINGAVVTITKMQKKKTGKPDANGVSKVTLTNTYTINGVPKTERDFKKDLSERGFDFERFLELSHLDVFTSQKNADMRKYLFSMTTSKTDLDVALSTKGCEEVAALLEKYKADEIDALYKATKKKAEEQLTAIPNQIIGLEKAKVDIDVAELELQKNALKKQIVELEKQVSDGSSGIQESDSLVDEIRSLKGNANDFKSSANKSLSDHRTDLRAKISEVQTQQHILESDLRNAKFGLQQVENDISYNMDMVKKAQADYTGCTNREFDETKLHEIESEQFDENSLICPTCKQPMPADKQDAIRDSFETGKKERIEQQERAKAAFNAETEKMMAQIIREGNQANERLKCSQERKKEIETKISMIQNGIQEASAEILRLSTELSELPQERDLSGDESYQKILSQIAEKESALREITVSSASLRETMDAELRVKRQELSDIIAEIAKSENNVRIDEQISGLEERKKSYAQAKADAEKILYQLSLVSREKNELLTSEINEHFDGVRFKLYDYLKNGSYQETCIPEIFDGKEWKNMFESANTSLSMRGKIRIIDGLQKFHDQYLPVFVDYASEFDNGSIGEIQTDCQMIYLKVVDDGLKVQEI